MVTICHMAAIDPDPAAVKQWKLWAHSTDRELGVQLCGLRDMLAQRSTNDRTCQSSAVENVAREVVASAKSGENGTTAKF